MEKINTDNLFVGCKVAEVEHLIEPYVHYETFGDVLHQIVVSHERILVYLKDDETAIDVLSGEEVMIANYERSFHTRANDILNVRITYMNGGKVSHVPPGFLKEHCEKETMKKINQVGYLMSFRKYINQRLNVDLEEVTLSQARFLLYLANMKKIGTVVLSEDLGMAKFQLEEILEDNMKRKRR